MLCLKTKGSEKAPKAAELPTNFFLSPLRLIAYNKYNLDVLSFEHYYYCKITLEELKSLHLLR